MKKLLYDTETLTTLLDISSEVLGSWEKTFGIKSKINGINTKEYSDEAVNFLKKVKLLTLNDFDLDAIKQLLSLDIEALNENSAQEDAKIIDSVEDLEYSEKIKTDNLNILEDTIDKKVASSDMMLLFRTILEELKKYTERTIEAEKKIYLLEDHENRIKNDYCEVCSELRRVKLQLDDKEQKLRDYDEQKKRLNLLEVQLKIMQIEKSKKKFWEFWK